MRFWIRLKKSLVENQRRSFCIRIIVHEVEIAEELLLVTIMGEGTNVCTEKSILAEKS
jgi:hypothetical protein